jgi:hypothetical protein
MLLNNECNAYRSGPAARCCVEAIEKSDLDREYITFQGSVVILATTNIKLGEGSCPNNIRDSFPAASLKIKVFDKLNATTP